MDRTEEDFDPGAKFHVTASVPYVRYFIPQIVSGSERESWILKLLECFKAEVNVNSIYKYSFYFTKPSVCS